jgi:hypothetical protein
MLPSASPSPVPVRKYLRIAEAASYLNVSVAFLRKQKGLGRGPQFSRFSDLLIYSTEDLDDYFRSNLVQTQKAA